MKKVLLILALVVGSMTTYATENEVNTKALTLLLKANPTVTSEYDDEINNKSFVELYATWAISNVPYFEDSTDGVLATTLNSCEKEADLTYTCTLIINVERGASYNEEGNIIFSEEKTESQIHFIYKTDKNVKKIIGDLEVIIAG